VILPDVNVLVYAYRREYAEHERYRTWLQAVMGGTEDLALIDPVLVGFARIVTHPRIFEAPAPLTEALDFIGVLRSCRAARQVVSTDHAWRHLAGLAAGDRHVRGNLVPDAFIAAAATTTGSRVATADACFGRFPDVAWFDPLHER
jgi:toxin-antitoxin system PIN domain toxin